jgi:hypothetical protein
MADIILHETVLCFGTEGYPKGDDIYDIRYPGWAGEGSGIHIDIGFDIGASGYSPERIQFLMENKGIEQWQINEFKVHCYRTFNAEIPNENLEANKIVERLRDELKIKWTQQQC